MDADTKTITAAAAAKLGSYYKLAKHLKITQASVSNWKSGKKKPNAGHLLEMLRIAGKLLIVGSLSLTVSGLTSPPAKAENFSKSVYYVKLRRLISNLFGLLSPRTNQEKLPA